MVLGKRLAGLSAEDSGTLWNPRYWFAGPIRRTTSGTTVTPSRALTCGPYYACLRCVSEDIGSLPLELYRRQSDGGRKLADSHPLTPVLDETDWETITQYALSRGNGIAEIQRDGAGDVVRLWPIHPTRMRYERKPEGGLRYFVKTDDINAAPGVHEVELDAADIFHLRGPGDSEIGYSTIELAAESVGLCIAQNQFASSFFGNGAHTSVVLKHEGQLGPEGRQNLRESWNETYQGASNGNKVAVLEEGITLEKTSVNPDEAQFLESRQWQVEEICRWFRVPPMKIGHNQNTPYTNVEQLNLTYLGDALRPWLVRITREVKAKLLTEKERKRYYPEFDTQPLMAADAQGRAQFYQTMIGSGAMTINEAREREKLPDADGGDQPIIQQGFTTLERVAAGENVANPTPTEPEADEPAPEEQEDMPEDDEAQAVSAADVARPFIRAEVERMCRKEDRARSRALTKHKGDPTGLAQWEGKFYAEWADEICANLNPSCAIFDQPQAISRAVDAYCASCSGRAKPDPSTLYEAICKELF